MPALNNAMDIFKLLEKSNCRECNETTCLAFAGAVFQERKTLDQCPRLDRAVIERYGGKLEKPQTAQADMEKALQLLKNRAAAIDLPAVASKLGGRMGNGRLTLKVLGKDFSVDSEGNLYSDIHVHPGVVIPILNYIIDGGGIPASGKWVPLRELPSGQDWYRLFGQRCEKPMKKLADTYPDLFEDLVHIFNGKRVTNHYQSDIALVLHPLPNLPLLICYWKPEEGLASELNLFFDATAEKNLNIDSIFALGTGLMMMFEKIALRHGSN
ncbi:MAG: DUF3786 domain-containing protein [Desulfobacterales bacterium]|nr:DUF3786 domain-containing protein [Desulfobacterales bacterium]